MGASAIPRTLGAGGRPTPREVGPARGRRPGASATPAARAIEEFERSLKAQERSPCTVKQYVHIARTFLTWVNKPIAEVVPGDLDRFREYLVLERHYSKNSLYTTVRGLACLLRTFGSSAAEGFKPPRRPERLPRYLSEEETHRLFEAVQGVPRDRALVQVLAYAGLRVGELCRLNLEDLELDRSLLHVRSGKGDKDREVILDERARAAIERYLAERATTDGPPSPRLFPIGPVTVERVVREAARRAGIAQRVTPHMLRHTLATTLLSRGCDIRHIQKLLGHASVATTQIYTHVDTQSLRAAYERAKPQF